MSKSERARERKTAQVVAKAANIIGWKEFKHLTRDEIRAYGERKLAEEDVSLGAFVATLCFALAKAAEEWQKDHPDDD